MTQTMTDALRRTQTMTEALIRELNDPEERPATFDPPDVPSCYVCGAAGDPDEGQHHLTDCDFYVSWGEQRAADLDAELDDLERQVLGRASRADDDPIFLGNANASRHLETLGLLEHVAPGSWHGHYWRATALGRQVANIA